MKVDRLRKSLMILSSNYNEQLEYLNQIGLYDPDHSYNDKDNVDEIALQFEDSLYIFLNDEINNQELFQGLNELKLEIESKSGEHNSDLWTVFSLKNDVFWDMIRRKAANCLRLIDDP